MSGGGSGAVSRLIGSKISVVSQGNVRSLSLIFFSCMYDENKNKNDEKST